MKNITYLLLPLLFVQCSLIKGEKEEDLYPNYLTPINFEDNINNLQEFYLAEIYSENALDIDNDGVNNNSIRKVELLNYADCIDYKIKFTSNSYILDERFDNICSDFDGVKEQIGKYTYNGFLELENDLSIITQYLNLKEIQAFSVYKSVNSGFVLQMKAIDQEEQKQYFKILFIKQFFDFGIHENTIEKLLE